MSRPITAADLGRPSKRRRVDTITSNAESAPTSRTSGSSVSPQIIFYDVPPTLSETELYRKLHSVDTSNHFARQLRDARRILSVLGPFASDWLWRCWVDGKISSSEGPVGWCTGSKGTDTAWVVFRQVVQQWNFEVPQVVSGSDFAPQFLQLVQTLKLYQTLGPAFRGIVIVQERIVALALSELLEVVDECSDFIRPTAVLDSGSSQQRTALDSFRAGKHNLLIVAESTEHMEIIPPSLVIWFDIYTRDHPPVVWQTPPSGNTTQVVFLLQKGHDLQRDVSKQCSALRMEHPGDTFNLSEEQVLIEDPTTGRTLVPRDAPGVLDRFAETLHGWKGNTHDLLPVWKRLGPTAYQCTIKFPAELGGHTVSASDCNAMEAKRLACFLTCQELFSQGLLDYRLFPPSTLGSSSYDVTMELKSSSASTGTRCYPKRVPSFWRRSSKLPPCTLYPTAISVDVSSGTHHCPVLLLTRSPLSSISAFHVFVSGVKGRVKLRKAQPLTLDDAQITIIHGYTTRISRAVLNKPVTFTTEELSYLFAPLRCDWKPPPDTDRWWDVPDISEFIQWESAKLAANHYIVPLVSEGSSLATQAQDSIVQDRWVEFTNRQYLIAIRHDLTPLSKPEEGTREEGHSSYLAYCEGRRKDFSGLKDNDQPMVEVCQVPNAINALDPFGKQVGPSSKTSPKYLIPELCAKLTIPASTFRTAQLLPSIMHHIDDVLLVKELNSSLFGDVLREDLLLAALSCPSANVENDYERLELLGDAFLKYVSSIDCFVAMPQKREGPLHAARQQIISNRALHAGIVHTGLPSYIQGKPFILKVWLPTIEQTTANPPDQGGRKQDTLPDDPAVNPEQKRGKRKRQQEDQNIQWLGDKTVADVVEAIIGAAYLTSGVDLALKVTQKLNIAISNVQNWTEFNEMFMKTGAGPAVDLPPATIKAIEAMTGHEFVPALLAQAMSHPSLNKPKMLPYDRLEFLGDAVLDFLAVRYLFDRHPHLPPGGLTLLKAAMVTNSTLATICVLIGLHKHVQYSSPDLFLSINVYAETVLRLRDEEDKLSKSQGRPPGQFWAEVEAPKVLSDVVESVIGALLVSDGFSLSGVETFFDGTLKPFFERYIRMQTLSRHPNVTLYNLFNSVGCQQHKIAKDVDNELIRCSVIIHDVALATVSGTSGSATVRKVSTSALHALEGDPEFLTRVCDCRSRGNQKKSQSREQKVQLGYENE